jgi:transposase
LGYSIITFDEVSFRLVPVYKRIWYMRGQKPNGYFFWSNKKLNMIGALIDGKDLYYEWHVSYNSLTFMAFLSGLKEKLDPNKKYVFILDNAAYHKTKIVLNYFKKIENVVVEFLPPYSPELNPTETCWKIIRNKVTNSTYFSSIQDMQEAIDLFLEDYFFMLNPSNYLCR